MQVSEKKLKHVARLSELCTEKAKTRKLSTEALLSLPPEVVRDLCGTSRRSNKSCIVLITDSPFQSDGNIVRGAICGYHVLSREFLFGEYEAAVFLEPLENVTWTISVHVKKIVMFIQGFFHEQALDVWNETSSFSNLKCLELENRKRIEAVLYQQAARWVLKYNCYIACKLTDEFIKLAQVDTIKLKMMVL